MDARLQIGLPDFCNPSINFNLAMLSVCVNHFELVRRLHVAPVAPARPAFLIRWGAEFASSAPNQTGCSTIVLEAKAAKSVCQQTCIFRKFEISPNAMPFVNREIVIQPKLEEERSLLKERFVWKWPKKVPSADSDIKASWRELLQKFFKEPCHDIAANGMERDVRARTKLRSWARIFEGRGKKFRYGDEINGVLRCTLDPFWQKETHSNRACIFT